MEANKKFKKNRHASPKLSTVRRPATFCSGKKLISDYIVPFVKRSNVRAIRRARCKLLSCIAGRLSFEDLRHGQNLVAKLGSAGTKLIISRYFISPRGPKALYQLENFVSCSPNGRARCIAK